MNIVAEGFRVLRKKGLYIFAKRFLKFIHRLSYRLGSGRTCPVCGFNGRKFLPAGDPPRPESRCPKCWARERHRLLWFYIENQMDLSNNDLDILYFAPTNPIVDNLRESGTNIITTDLVMDKVDVNSDITHLPFCDGTFDLIICSHVLEHIPDDRAAISEMYRVLDYGGEALIMIPKDKNRKQTYEDDSVVSPEDREKEFGQKNHVRWYGKDFHQRLKDAGFDLDVMTYSNELDEEIVEKHGLKVDKPKHSTSEGTLQPNWNDNVKYEDIHHAKK